MVILDTNILIDHFRMSDREATSHFETLTKIISPSELAISLITVQELFTGKGMSNPKNFNRIQQLLQKVTLLPYSLKVALLAGEISREHTADMEFADAATVSTCLINDIELCTLNKKHFKGVKRIKLLDF